MIATADSNRRWRRIFLIVGAIITAYALLAPLTSLDAVQSANVPLLADKFWFRIATFIVMFIVMATAWNIIGGITGYAAFGNVAFFGIGAYTTGMLVAKAKWPFLVALPLAPVVAASFAALIGLPLLRLRGHYFAVASLSIGEVFREVAMSWTGVTGGGMGINLPPMRPAFGTEPQMFYYSMLALALVTLATTVLVTRSRLGVAFRCIRQNEEAASMIGIDATRAKIIAFALSATFPGAAGALYASWVSYIDPSDVFDILNSVKAPVMVLLGGVGTVIGPAIGALLYLVFEEIVWRSLLQFHAVMLGVIIVGLVLFLPSGFVDVLRRRRLSRSAQ